MNYRAVGNRCAVDLSSLALPLSEREALIKLKRLGFKTLEVDLVALARQCIKTSRYRRGAKASEAPGVVDCSSFVKWLYGQRGIWLPRRSIQQRELGESVTRDNVIAGDLVFVKGAIDWYNHDPRDGVGHVGIATGDGTIVHAADPEAGVVETPFSRFVGESKLRGIRRYIPVGIKVVTLETPSNRGVETSDDVRWIVLQLLPR